jgi:HK97 family phage prohead protease
MTLRTIWASDGLEVRRQGKRPVIAGRFPYNALAVISNRGRGPNAPRKETIRPGAFEFSLRDESREINLLYGHSFDRPIASRSTGTLSLRDTPEALTFEAEIRPELEQVTHVRDAVSMIEAGMSVGISPGFMVPSSDVVPDAETLIPEPGNESVFIRVLNHLLLVELSIVTRPAYPESQAELRAQHVAHRVRSNHKVYLP